MSPAYWITKVWSADSLFSENIAHIIKEFSTQLPVSVVDWVHDHVVASPLQLIFNKELLIHTQTNGKFDFAGLCFIVREKLAQACHEQVNRLGFFKEREFSDPVFYASIKRLYNHTKTSYF